MTLKICVLLIAIFLLQNGQTFRFNGNSSNDEINENTVRMIQDVFKQKYPQAAIDKYISVMRQLYSKVPEEKKVGNFESVVLLVEGALYRIKLERKMREMLEVLETFIQNGEFSGNSGGVSGNPRQYDVRSALKRIDEASDSDEDSDWGDFNEKTVAAAKADLDKEFPSEVGQLIANIFTKVVKAETVAEAKQAAIELTILSMDGAREMTSRFQTLPTQAI